MALEVIWSPQAEESLLNLIEYLNINWGEKAVKNFLNKLESIIEVIGDFPEAYFLFIKSKGIRRVVIVSQVSLYYKRLNDEIVIVTLFDNRMHPSKIRKSLRSN